MGGHWYPDVSTDPWATYFATDSAGSGYISATQLGFSTTEAGGSASAYRALVLHGPGSGLVGCGLIGSPSTGVVTALSAYPGYTGSLAVLGTMAVTQTRLNSIRVEGTLTGLEALKDGGVHIHGTA